MTFWSCDEEVCAVCIYWAGKREMEFNGFFCVTRDNNGICLCPLSGSKGKIVPEDETCRKWKGFVQVEPIS